MYLEYFVTQKWKSLYLENRLGYEISIFVFDQSKTIIIFKYVSEVQKSYNELH